MERRDIENVKMKGNKMGKKEVKIDAIIEALNRDDYVDKFYNKATEYILDPNNKSSEYNGSRKYEKKIEEKNGKTDNKVSEEILEKHFRCYEPCQFSKDEQFRENKSLENILVKVTLLNAFYRTTINNIHLVALARYIQSLDIDSKLANNNGKPNFDLINDIAYKRDSDFVKFPVKKTKNSYKEEMNGLYSFATKYCAWHEPDIYPIVDSYTKGVLYRIYHDNECFRNHIEEHNPQITKLTQNSLNDYRNYYSIYTGLRDYLEKLNIVISFKDLDIFLWSYGEKNNIKI